MDPRGERGCHIVMTPTHSPYWSHGSMNSTPGAPSVLTSGRRRDSPSAYVASIASWTGRYLGSTYTRRAGQPMRSRWDRRVTSSLTATMTRLGPRNRANAFWDIGAKPRMDRAPSVRFRDTVRHGLTPGNRVIHENLR